MNPMDLLKNFQNIQSRFQEMQEKMKEVTVTGTAGGDMVKVELNGQMQLTNITIAPEVVDPHDVAMLEDLVQAAFTDASAKMTETIREEMSALTGGIDLPPGLMGL
jgi:DNA-binding YbaB/EbfC family protein